MVRLIGFALTLLLTGCSSETGILVGVSGSSVEELVFEVAVAEGAAFVLDQGASGETRDVRGRDLRLEPYEHLLRPEDPEAPPPQLRVLVLGRRGGKIVSFAVTDPPQAFLPGSVLRRGLLLQGLSSTVTAGALGKCYQARLSEKASFRLIAASDRDCDGFSPEDTPPDCDDDDSAVHPGASERCDGKDNNCDGKLSTVTEKCYALIVSPVPCRESTRTCNESSGIPSFSSCEPNGSSPAAPRGFCEGKSVDPIEGTCTVEVDPSGLCPGSVPLAPISGQPASCAWALIADGGWPLSLDGAAAPTSVASCTPSLAIAAGTPPAKGKTVVLELEATEGTSKTMTVVHATIEKKSVATCSSTPLVCAKPGG
jgi:hypothetical protein